MTRKLTVCRVDWDETAERHLAPAVDDAIDWVRSMVVSRHMILFGVELDGARVGTTAMRFQKGLFGNEAMIVGAGGRAPSGVSLTRNTMPLWDRIAAKSGANVIRMHTRKPALARELEYLGYDGGERVFMRELGNGSF